jgi:hypothetical protein
MPQPKPQSFYRRLPAGLGLLVLAMLLWQIRTTDPPPPEAGPAIPAATTLRPAELQVEPATIPDRSAAEPLPNLDTRENRRNQPPWRETPAMAAAAAGLRERVPGLKIDRDPVTGSPKWVASNQAWLMEGGGNLTPEEAVRLTRIFLEENEALFGHGPELLDEARIVTNYTHDRSTSRKVVWHQQYLGIEVFEAILQANFTGEGALMNIGSQFVPTPRAAGPADADADPVRPRLPVEKAVAIAGQSVGERIQAESIRATTPPGEGADRRQQFRTGLITDADARLTWLPTGPDTLVLTWDVTLTSPNRAEMYRTLVDASSGQVLLRHSLTAYNEASYRVHTTESPTPMSPGHEFPSSLQPLPVPRTLETLSSLNPVASPNGWINAGGDITSGNNADAYTDTDSNNTADLPRTTGSNRVFDFPLDSIQEPVNFKDASVTQLFYWTNFMHDRMYSLGFTEAAGNFQIDNFGRGGAGNDPVNAEAQDGSGTNNANFSTPVDGGRGRMQMYNWTAATPDRDGSFDAEVVFHEYGHGVSNRLVGGPSVSISALNTRGMGEGWSDFYGLALTAESSDNPLGNWALGGWNRYLHSGWFTEGYYYGLRRYSYSTDMRKNPLTFKDIDPTQINLHIDVPRNPTHPSTQDATQVHYQGTVWCVTLWDLRTNLILKHGFETGNERALFLVTEGMKLGPANPNFVQARDGIIQATMANHPADLGDVWTAFAKRGLGHTATAPASSTTTGVVEAYDVPDSLEITDRSGWTTTGVLGGSFAPSTNTLTLRNNGSTPLNWASAPGVDWLTVTPPGGSIAPGDTVSVNVAVSANHLRSGFHGTNLVFSNTATGFRQPVGVRLHVMPPVYESFDLSSDPGWTMTGEWAYGTPAGNASDPTSGATGSKVYGANLNGAVNTAVGGPFHLTTAPIDLSRAENTQLRFKRWLNTNTRSNTLTTVEVSTDGVNWREVFANPGTTIRDAAWQTVFYDISSIADRQSAVRIRWGYRNLTASTAFGGWNIDDVEILGQPANRLTMDLAETTSENEGTIKGFLGISPAQDTPVVVTLSSTDPASVTVPPTVTFAPGEVSKDFKLTLIDNPLLDGARVAQIRASSPITNPAARSLQITDDETAAITLNLPGPLSEGSATATGSLSLDVAPVREVVVSLASSLPSLRLPDSVTIPAGSAGPVNFTLTIDDNPLVDGPKTATVTATVPGWPQGSASVTINDNDSRLITLTGSTGAREGDGPTPFSVSVNTIQTSPLVLNITSDDTSEITLPSTVTIPAGAFTAGFSVTTVDDDVPDGIQTATITVTGPFFPNASRAFTVADNEVSHYTFSLIPSSQVRSRPFSVFVTARDVNGAVITNHTGGVGLSSASPGGSLPFSPGAISSFVDGVGSASVVFSAAGPAITLTATDGNGRTGTSNAFEVTVGSLLLIDPPGIQVTTTEDSSPRTAAVTLANPGSATTEWDVVTVLPGGPVTDPTLTEVLASLNGKFTSITNLIPNRFLFSEGVTGNNISDGGLDMYDGGNYLATDIKTAGSFLVYSDNLVAASSNLGTGGAYFTRKHPGLFVFAADLNGPAFFEITGNLGADGSGSTDLATLTSTRGATVYKGFVKRVYGTSDPSVNHLIIVEDNGVATHTGATSTDNDFHRVSGLSGVTRLYYLLYAGSSGGYINNASTQAIMEAFLDSVTGNAWLTAAPESGSIAAGRQAQVTATINPRGLAPGDYFASLRFRSNDLVSPSQDLPVTLTVRPGLDYFQWSEIPSPQMKDVPFAATLTARDSGGALVDLFDGPVRLQAHGDLREKTSGTGTGTNTHPLSGSSTETRLQVIYHPSEVGGAGRIEKLAFNVSTVPGALENFTIRLKHTLKPDYSGTGNAVWDVDGWTTVYRGRLSVPSTGWMEIPLSRFFDYDGTSNLMVDFSFDNATTVLSGAVRVTTVAQPRTLSGVSSGDSAGAPVSWSGNVVFPSTASRTTNLRFWTREEVACLPGEVTLSGGAWSGEIAIARSTPDVFLSARFAPRPDAPGDSNPFAVSSLGDLTLVVPAAGAEGTTLPGSVSLPVATTSPLTVSLASSDPTELTVPASVVIPAGETTAAFEAVLVDDGLLDLAQAVTLTATATSWNAAAAPVTVNDVATTTLSLGFPGSVNEGSTTSGTVNITGAAGADLRVTLSSSSDLLGVPAQVTIPQGSNSATFTLSGLQNTFIEANTANSVTVTATLQGFPPATAPLSVIDNESRQITLALPVSSISEGALPPLSSSRVTLAGPTRVSLTITLTSSDTGELLVPAPVTIPAGSAQSNVITVTPVNDAEFDGSQTVTVTASADGFLSGIRTVTVLDDDVHHFTFATINGPVYRSVPFPVTVTARDVNGLAISGYTGSPALSAGEGGNSLPVTPATIPGFVSGSRTANVTISSLAGSAVLTLTDPVTGGSGQSNAFAVASPPAIRFDFSPIPSPQRSPHPFPVTITAIDQLGATATGFTGQAMLRGVIRTPGLTVGTGTSQDSTTLNTSTEGSRNQILFLAPEVGVARTLTGLSLNIGTIPGMPLARFTIRLKHTTGSTFINGQTFDNTSLTTVYATSAESISATGWRRFDFTTPFVYNGTSNLLVDVAFDNTGTQSGGVVLSGNLASARRLYARNNRSTGYGDPLLWTFAGNLATVSRPNLIWHSDPIETTTPSITANFTAGVWTGEVAVQGGGSGMTLVAMLDGLRGESNSFDVEDTAPAPVLSPEPAFTRGLGNQLFWTAPAQTGAEAQVERSTTPDFSTVVTSPWTAQSLTSFNNLANGTLYYYRAKRRLPGAVPAPETWTQTTQSDFQSNTLAGIDLTTYPNSAAIATGTPLRTWTESFESTNANWSGTIFTQRTIGPSYTTDPAPVPSPNTTPLLPISADADREGEMSSGTGYALQSEEASNRFSNGTITAHVYPRATQTLVHGGVVLRASGSGSSLNGYLARLHYNSSSASPVWMGVSRITNGLQTTIITAFGSTSFNPATEHFKIQLAADGSTLTARFWRVSVIGGVTTETLVSSSSTTDSNHAYGVAGLYTSGNVVYDDVVITESQPNAATMVTPVIQPSSFSKWGNLAFTRTTPTGTTATVDVLNAAGNLLVQNVTSGTDLANLTALQGQTSIRLRANLTLTSPAVTPQLHDWSVQYVPPRPTIESEWSNVVSSRQDATPPLISVASIHQLTSNPQSRLTGTASDPISGISGVSARGLNAESNDSFSTWSLPVADLAEGSNQITITASDNAVPPNTATVTSTIHRISDGAGDSNQNGIPNLLEYALGIPSSSTRPHAFLPQTGLTTDPGTGERAFTMEYRRRISREQLAYTIEVSFDLETWTDVTGQVREMAVTPAGDGITERVMVRVTVPGLGQAVTGFLRLNVAQSNPVLP